ncbi:hypothetical protein [Arthrobacter sp. FW306-06-A]|uniref:hypothetical protein n=1 Tax=Arthrobacter sp. FW306-06-A TaxID=2879621 RepID=UPI001F30BA34|nr:hypothetical protein [Arthrobacter sp. FW306-06-A]UKA69569.1 hypothetical protein LFT49_12380 [Arthrobacter sp. FW306-06-A]
MPASKYTQEQRDEAVELYRAEGPTAVEKQLGIPKNTVMHWAKKARVRTVRTDSTREAVEAKVVDGKLRRANIADRLYAQAETALDTLEGATFRTLIKGTQGRDKDVTLQFVPPNDRRTLVQTISTALAATAKLESLDAGHDTTAADSVVDRLMAGFRTVYEAGQ